MTPEQFEQLLAKRGIVLTPVQKQQYQTYYQLLVSWNEKMNLTAITDEPSVYLKHFYDSLTLATETNLLKETTQPITLCDVGAGAGFPSIPLKIALPHLHVTIVDSLQKRMTFLNIVIDTLQLDNVTCYHDRAETFGQNVQFREQFDIVTARAVARLNLLSEFCLPLVKPNGYFAALKASRSIEELTEAKRAIETLGGQLVDDLSFELPNEAGMRHIIVINKVKNTPKKYPRKPGIPSKNPLQ